ncbi:MAG: adenylate/guanylate cyclase domain-containing protein [Pseudomonadota bacterium]
MEMIRRRRVSIATLFSSVLAAIVLISVGTLFAISTLSARSALLEDLATDFDLTIATIEERVTDHLAPVTAQLGFLDSLIAVEPALLNDRDRLANSLRISMAAAPQVSAIAFVRPDDTSLRYEATEGRFFFDDLADRPDIQSVMEMAKAAGPGAPDLGWSEPIYSPNLGRTIIVLQRAVWVNGQLQGVLFAGVDLFALSRYANRVASTIGQTVFLLHGRERVLAHPNLLTIPAAVSEEQPLLGIGQVEDPKLATIWREDRLPIISNDLMLASEGHYLSVAGGAFVYVYGTMEGYGKEPWLVGFHFDTLDGSVVDRFWALFAVGLGIVILFTAVGYLLGQRLARPFRTLTDNAQALQRLDFGGLRPLRGSRILELDRTATAFERMVDGLRVFGRYVPGRVVERIVRDGDGEAAPAERQVTMLFTDIAGFSKLAEDLSPQQTAQLLNDHFSLVGRCVEEAGGTIDKYTGDGLLAFWGAPDAQADQADRALRAALAIRAAVEADNKARQAEGEAPIRLRIGIHTGPVLVGDIGAESRINYTIIGDAVNVASRAESLDLGRQTETVRILVTEQTLAESDCTYETETLGPTALQGRSAPVVLHSLRGRQG